MIDRETADKAIHTAREFLKDTPELSWARKSSLTARAFYIGVFAALSGIADVETLKGLMVNIAVDTAFARSADDSFGSTSVGQRYQRLQSVAGSEQLVATDIQNCIYDLQHSMEQHAYEIQQLTLHALKLIEQLKKVAPLLDGYTLQGSGSKCVEHWRELNNILAELEHSARRIALLETDHSMEHRFSD